jgi:hypothetical protein
MGLLDDLKKQADLVKSQQLSQHELRREAVKLVDGRMRQSFQYLNELLKQLAVLKPVNPLIYMIPGIIELKDLRFTESFIDFRTRRIDDKDTLELVSFFIKWSLPARVTLERDMPAAALKVREALFQHGIKYNEEEVKGGRITTSSWKFAVESAVVSDLKIRADHENMRLLISAKNLLRLGLDEFVVPAGDIDEVWLEDFAKTLLGHPTGFRKYRAVVPFGKR